MLPYRSKYFSFANAKIDGLQRSYSISFVRVCELDVDRDSADLTQNLKEKTFGCDRIKLEKRRLHASGLDCAHL